MNAYERYSDGGISIEESPRIREPTAVQTQRPEARKTSPEKD